MYELIYTSVPKGLLPGRSGFATAAMSEGMPPNLIVPLENLSGYNFTLRDNTFLPVLNPPCCYYIKMRYGNQLLHIAGKVAPNGLDYSQRNNKIAHHLLFESPGEMSSLAGGAAGLFLQDDVFCSNYTAEPAMLPFRRVPVCTQVGPLPAKNWAKLAGHAGFAAYAAEKFIEAPDKPLYLIYPVGTPLKSLLALVMEACALLNENVRKNFTFSTYFGSSGASVDCFLRMVPDFSPLVSNLRRFHRSDVIELGTENELLLSDKYPDIYEYACTGKKPETRQIKPQAPDAGSPVKVIEDDDFPTAPPAAIEDVPPTISIPPPAPPVNYRKFVFAGAAAVIIAAIASFLLYDISSKQGKPEKSDKQTVTATVKNPLQPQAVPAVKTAAAQTAAPENKLPKQPAAAPAVSVAPAVPTAEPAKKPQPVKKQAEPAKKPTPLRQENLPMQTEMELFIKVREVGNSDTVIQLPPQLHGVQSVYPVIEKIGTGNISAAENSKFVEKGVIPGEVFIRAAIGGTVPPQPVAGNAADNPHLLLKVSQDKKSLQIIRYTGNRSDCIMPELSKIKQIYFSFDDKVCLWNNSFAFNHAAMLKPGSIAISINNNNPPGYTPGKLEENLKKLGLVTTRFGNATEVNFRSTSFYLAQWNRKVDEFANINRQYKQSADKLQSMSKCTAPQRTAESIEILMNDLEKRARSGSIAIIKKEFPNFLDKFFNPREKTSVSIDELQLLANRVAHTLLERQLSNSRKQEIYQMQKSWNSTIAELNNFRKLAEENKRLQKKIEATRQELTYAREKVVTAGNFIHPSIGQMLSNMAKVRTHNGQEQPDKITGAEVADLCKAIKEKITFIPIVSSSYGE